MAQKPHVLIAGAGMGGLALALALLRHGYDVDVYEEAPILAEVGAGIQISANGTRVLDWLGCGDGFTKYGWEPKGKEVRLWNTGETWPLFDLGVESVARYGFPYIMFHRADLHTMLLDGVEALKPDAVHLGCLCTGFDQDASGVTLRIEGGETARGDVLIGADGVKSRIREALFGPDKPRYMGVIAWRGLIPAETLPADLIRPVGTNWIGPGGHIVHYFLRRGELLNVAAHVERQAWTAESWTTEGDRDEMHRDFEGWHADIHTMIDLIAKPFILGLHGREPLMKWGEGRVSLLGDACHPTLPFLAQGAQMAFEDAVVLTRCLEASGGALEDALRRYEQVRNERTRKIVQGSSENTTRFHNPALADRDTAFAFVNEQWAPERVMERYEWLFEYDATSVAVA